MVLYVIFSSFSLSFAAFYCSSLKVLIDFSSILMAFFDAFKANVTFLLLLLWIVARIVYILKSLSKWRQFNDYGFGSSSLWEKTLFVFLFLTDFAALPDRFILEIPLAFDLFEAFGFLSALLLISFWDDLMDLDAYDFLLFKLRLLLWLLTVIPSSYP